MPRTRIATTSWSLLTTLSLFALCWTSTASAQRIGARVTPEGLDAMARLARDLAPEMITTTELDTTVFECPGTPRAVTGHVPPTDIALNFDSIGLRAMDGTLQASVVFDVDVATDVFIDNPYACLGEAECDVTASVQNLEVDVTLALMSTPDGIALSASDVELALTPADLNIQSEGCVVGEVATWLFNTFENWALERGIPRMEMMLQEQISMLLSTLLADSLALEVEFGSLSVAGSLDTLDAATSLGLTATGDMLVDYTGDVVFEAPAPPAQEASGNPFDDEIAGMFQLAIADQAVNDALYATWRGGVIRRLLRTPVANPRIDLTGVGVVQQIGLPEGTNLAISADFEAPLEIRFGRRAEDVTELHIRELHVTIDVRAPATAAYSINAWVSGVAAAALQLDPASGGLSIRLDDLSVDSLRVEGEGDGFTFDGSRFEAFLSRTVVPLISERLASLPVAPSVQEVFGQFVLLRTISSSAGWQRLGVDVHSPDPSDTSPPSTFLTAPPSLFAAGTASIQVSGEDDTTPAPLLRYRTWLDGTPLGEPSSLTSLRFDATDGDHELRVTALDLQGNEDPSPAVHTFVVDGTPPTIEILEAPPTILDGNQVSARWQASDERGVVQSRWLLRRVPDGAPREVVEEGAFAAGEGSMSAVGLRGGELYELLIEARDEAGNLTSVSYGLAPNPGGGCSAGGLGDASGAGMIALLLFTFVRRRR